MDDGQAGVVGAVVGLSLVLQAADQAPGDGGIADDLLSVSVIQRVSDVVFGGDFLYRGVWEGGAIELPLFSAGHRGVCGVVDVGRAGV